MTTDIAIPADAPTRTVAVIPYAYWPMNERWGYARTLAHAGDMIPSGLRIGADVEATAARVFLVLETGAMLGLHPMAALQGIDVIKGTAAISPQTFSGLARAAGMKLRIKEVGTIETGDFAIEVTLQRPEDDGVYEARFSMKDALRAELISKYEPKVAGGEFVVVSSNDNWRKYPQDMCQWRAIGRLARRGAADVTMGIGYFPEELEVLVNEDGYRRDMTEFEDALIAEFEQLDDKKDMADIWQREHPKATEDAPRVATDAWTQRVQAAFDAHLLTLTKDSRPPKEGAPGQTGDKAIDGPKADAATGEVEDATADESEGEPVPVSAPMPSEFGGAAREVSVAAADDAERAERKAAPALVETDAEREAREDAENYAAFLAEQEADKPATETAAPGLDMSALETKPEA